MITFGEFFDTLRRHIEQTGRTDSQCGDMDDFKNKRCTERVIYWNREDRGWQAIAKKKLSHSNLLEFSAEMAQAGMKRLLDRAKSSRFDPVLFGWELDSAHEFHRAMLEEAREVGLDVDSLSRWGEAREARKTA